MPLKKEKSKKPEMKKNNKVGKSKPESKEKAGKLKGKKLNEAAKAKKDYDKDGKVETLEQEYKGSKDRAIKKAKGAKGAKGKKPSTLKENFNNYIKGLLKKAFLG
jgi:hypothetical protein